MLKAGRVVAWYEIEQRIRYLWPDDLPALRFGEPISASRSYMPPALCCSMRVRWRTR